LPDYFVIFDTSIFLYFSLFAWLNILSICKKYVFIEKGIAQAYTHLIMSRLKCGGSKPILIVLFTSVALIICLIFTLVSLINPEKKADDLYYTAREIIDGDTIILITGERIRYLGIDTPELHHPTIGKECGGQEAKNENAKLLTGKRIRIEKDVTDKDQYGRLLRYVFTEDGYFVNYEIIRRGWAQVYVIYPDRKYEKILIEAQLSAKKDNVGIWKYCINRERGAGNESK